MRYMAENVLDERQSKILDFIVRDYIKIGEPVSSAHIRDSLRLSESPATIRNVVVELAGMNYLEQPHTSAGRIPTDRAYRYFVDHLMTEMILRPLEIRHFKEALDEQHEMIHRFFSDALNLLSIISINGVDRNTHSYGISYLLKEPEFHEKEIINDIGYILDHSDETMNIYHRTVESGHGLFIGKENPVDQASACGIFYFSCNVGNQEQSILLVGPKRMDYERVSAFIRYFLERV